MAIVFLMNKEIARGMVCFFHQKKHSYLIMVSVPINLLSLSIIGRFYIKKNFAMKYMFIIHGKVFIQIFFLQIQMETGKIQPGCDRFWPRKRFSFASQSVLLNKFCCGWSQCESRCLFGVVKASESAQTSATPSSYVCKWRAGWAGSTKFYKCNSFLRTF
jgi:hypothetical protein